MSRSLMYRWILIIVLIVLALWQLYPTLNLSKLIKQKDEYYSKVAEISNIKSNDIENAVLEENLENVILRAIKDSSKTQEGRDLAQRIITLDENIDKTERSAIKRGLDLQGGTYLVYEVDFPHFMKNVAKNPDAAFERIMKEVDFEAKSKNLDFFDVLQSRYVSMSRNLSEDFGKRGEVDRKILADLRKETEDAIDRSLEVLRNRIDQFGVAEPSITKQGNRRIVVELAGIQDVNRAKTVIGRTAQLEFKLMRDADYTRSLLMKIDEVVKKRRLGSLDSTALAKVTSSTDTSAVDSAAMKEKIRKDKEVNLNELFGDVTNASGDGDTSLSVDTEMFEENPFLALLGNLGNMIAAPKQNMRAVDIILNYPEVQKIIPEESQFLWHNKARTIGDKEWYYLHLLKKAPELTGESIADAQVQVAGEASGSSMTGAGQAKVLLALNSSGAKRFARVTGANIGKILAIVLDDKVASAPTVQDKISDGRAEITGMANIDEAKDLVVVLRAGALPARLESIEERTVGPSLGQDSIKKGNMSAIAGLIIVFIFMAIYYKMSGLIADFALLLNMLFLVALLAAFHATLTLPGIAGIILTIGMSVDANVLINERIREELRSGKTIRAAIDTGYSRAFITILDSNLTTLITALVLYQFGTGPIQGFAVTLIIGIIVSMFTAIVVTRSVLDFMTSKWEIKNLSI
ncbi:MAG: protein translocase subunit SecD [Candidatus Zhuqueibacterota bacterium]